MGRLLTILGGGGFLPSKLPNLTIWLDSQSFLSDGSSKDGSDLVATWVNKTGLTANAVQSTGANKPKYIASAINSKPALEGRHDGVNTSTLAITDSAALDYTAFTSFIVAQRVTDLGANETVFAKFLTTGNQREFRFVSSPSDRPSILVSQDGGITETAASPTPTLSIGSPFIAEIFNSGTQISCSINGATATTNTVSAVFNGTAPVNIFSRGSEPFAGYIGEVLWWPRLVAASDRTQVRRYLSSKWNIAVS